MFSVMAMAQMTVADAWKAMPDSILPYFNSQLRSEIIDMYKISHDSKTKNLLEGESSVKSLTDTLLCLQLNPSTEMQLMLLPKTASIGHLYRSAADVQAFRRRRNRLLGHF